MEFYTDNGFKGINYNGDLSLKEIAVIVRNFVKQFTGFKFSVTIKDNRTLQIKTTQTPHRPLKTFNELNNEEREKTIRKYLIENRIDAWHTEKIIEAIKPVYDSINNYFPKFLTDEVKEVIDKIDNFVRSYIFEDIDGMIDYANVNFWYFGVSVKEVI